MGIQDLNLTEEQSLAGAGPGPGVVSTGAAPSGGLLVVDDEPDVGAVLEEYFAGRGFQIHRALGGLEALSKIEKHQPGLVLLDVRMPEMDGIEVLKKIRAAGPEPAVLMMSANDDVALAQHTIELGALDYVLKPFDFEHLERVVQKTLVKPAAPSDGAADQGAGAAPSASGLVYELAIEVFKATRALSPEARSTVGLTLESVALGAVQKGSAAERPEVIKALNQLRMLIRFARDLGDIGDEQHRVLESQLVRARRAHGLT